MNKSMEEIIKKEVSKKLRKANIDGMLQGGKIVADMVKNLASQGKSLDEIIHLTESFTNGTMEKIVNKNKGGK